MTLYLEHQQMTKEVKSQKSRKAIKKTLGYNEYKNQRIKGFPIPCENQRRSFQLKASTVGDITLRRGKRKEKQRSRQMPNPNRGKPVNNICD